MLNFWFSLLRGWGVEVGYFENACARDYLSLFVCICHVTESVRIWEEMLRQQSRAQPENREVGLGLGTED